MNNKIKLTISLIAPQAAGLIGSIFTASSVTGWYSTVTRPELAPPNWIFGPVWTTLFVLMGIALFLVWKKEDSQKKKVKLALQLFVAQLVLNTLWSVIFFGLQSPGWAFVEIIFLWISITLTITVFTPISRLAAWLLVPYLAWVSFAAYLNYSIWVLN
jgi:tryptophan-rich sensory protein